METTHSQPLTLDDLWAVVDGLIYVNATHTKRNVQIRSITPEMLLCRCLEELGEVSAEHTKGTGNDTEELGDLLALLIHYAIKKQITAEQLVATTITKLTKIFAPVTQLFLNELERFGPTGLIGLGLGRRGGHAVGNVGDEA